MFIIIFFKGLAVGGGGGGRGNIASFKFLHTSQQRVSRRPKESTRRPFSPSSKASMN